MHCPSATLGDCLGDQLAAANNNSTTISCTTWKTCIFFNKQHFPLHDIQLYILSVEHVRHTVCLF
uniref:Uncharacterized protein n=1 Tax=Anguilla anguilla TaxID=7936 RepID=A0A0E9TG00_ANGAN